MTTTTCPSKTTSFFELLEQTPGLDMRDNRGKRHSIALVISGLVMALCCGRDGKLSSLHRNMVNHFSALCKATNSSQTKPISRSQLPILLAKVNGAIFSKLLLDWFNIELDTEQKRWFSCDGKELCGSIQPGKQRGEACVSVVAHDTQRVVGQTYYQGLKESERPATYQLLNDLGLYNQKLTFDALHLNPLLVNAIEVAGGTYLIGLKANQYHLYRHCICLEVCQSAEFSRDDATERGHGRLEQRSYQCFKINRSNIDVRWHIGGPQSLLVVNRQRQSLDGKWITNEKSYYASNAIPECQAHADELFNAIRQHWCVESMHYQRDVTLSEDNFRTKNGSVSRLMSSLRTLTINLLKGCNGTGSKIKNMAAQLDNFADNIQTLIQFLTKELIL